MLKINNKLADEALAKEDYIAIEQIGDDLILYFNNEKDLLELFDRMRAVNHEDAELKVSKGDPCSSYSKKQCDSAGGCCKWVTSGSFNYCKCI